MRFYIIITLLVCKFSYAAVSPEKYYVIFVKGKILVESTKLQIKVGDLLTSDDKILVADKDAKASVITSGKGRFDIRFDQKNNAGSEVYADLKSSLVACVANPHISIESIDHFNGQDPSTYFACPDTKNRILIIENEPFLIVPTYDVEGSSFFFFQFMENGKTIKHKIQDSAQNIMLATTLFVGDTGERPEQISLGFQTSKNGKSQPTIIAEFYPVLAPKGVIVSEINIIKKVIGTKNQKKLKAEILNHLYDNYGKIGIEEIESLVVLDK